MTRRRLLLLAGTAVVVVVVATGFVLWPRGTTEISADDALDDFRERSTSTEADGGSPGPATPSDGVYSYTATGQEEVTLGPLPSETRPLPETVTATVVNDGDGCFTWTLNLFVQHTEDTRWCDVDGGLVLDDHVKHQQIAALAPTATMDCDPAVVRDDTDDDLDLSCSLTLDGGPAAITATLTGTATTGGPESITVDGSDVDVVPTTVTYDVTGGLSGTWTETVWRSAALLPVRVERTVDLSGPATFVEDSLLELTSLEPTT